MNWIKHPSYLQARDNLVRKLKPRTSISRHLKPVVFLCGAAKSDRRDNIKRFIAKRKPQLSLFYAEHVWELISSRRRNALELENELGAFADVLIVILESPGTFAEIGAFATNKKLRPKLLPIVDKKYKGKESFLETGPLKWIEKDSRFGPPIYSDFDTLLEALQALDKRLDPLNARGRVRDSDRASFAENPRQLLLFIVDLVSIVGPAPVSLCQDFLSKVSAEKASWDAEDLLALAVALGLVEMRKIGGHAYFERDLRRHSAEPFDALGKLDLPAERARYWSALARVPGASDVLLSKSG